MVKSNLNRVGKYEKKIDSSVIGRRYEDLKQHSSRIQAGVFREQVKMEQAVKSIVNSEPSITQHFYIAFAEELLKKKLERERLIIFDKWRERGLKESVLNKIVVLLTPGFKPVLYWFGDWKYRRKLTFDNSGITENLTDFTVLVRLTGANFNFAKAKANGEDIRFKVSEEADFLNYEIEKWTDTEAIVWVKVPLITAGSITDAVYMYYGSKTAVNGQNVTGTWDSNFVGVWHMKDKTLTTIADSTINANTGTKKAVGAPLEIDGQIGKAQLYDGIDDFVNCGNNPVMSPSAQITLSAWAYVKDAVTNQFVIDSRQTGTDGALLQVEGSNFRFTLNNVVAGRVSTIVPAVDAWYHIVGTYDKTLPSANVKIYINGDLKATKGYTTDIASANRVTVIGARFSKTLNWFNGAVDEVRISNINRSAPWVKAQHRTQTDIYITYGSEETK